MPIAGNTRGVMTPLNNNLGHPPSQRAAARTMPTIALFSFGSKKREEKKRELLQFIKPLRRGLIATPDDALTVDKLCKILEGLNPNKASLASPLINGRWELQYTTSESILGKNKPALLRPSGPIYQFIDVQALTASNQETAPLFNQVPPLLCWYTCTRVQPLPCTR